MGEGRVRALGGEPGKSIGRRQLELFIKTIQAGVILPAYRPGAPVFPYDLHLLTDVTRQGGPFLADWLPVLPKRAAPAMKSRKGSYLNGLHILYIRPYHIAHVLRAWSVHQPGWGQMPPVQKLMRLFIQGERGSFDPLIRKM
ncbi:MAG: hypothetical protein DPW18_02950 [Chloroflexi bacterium]|nr:hypothetical protein [Chloroflexota bacterium]